MLSKIRGDVSYSFDLPLVEKRTSNNSLYSGKRLFGHFLCALMHFSIPAVNRTGTSVRQVAGLFVLSLIPIALAYHLAHYLSYLVLVGQYIIPLAADPFGMGWDLFGTRLPPRESCLKPATGWNRAPAPVFSRAPVPRRSRPVSFLTDCYPPDSLKYRTLVCDRAASSGIR